MWPVTVDTVKSPHAPLYTLDYLNDCEFSLPLSRFVVDLVAGLQYSLSSTPHMTASHSLRGECPREALHEAYVWTNDICGQYKAGDW